MTVFGPGEADTCYPAEVPWDGPLEVRVAHDGVSARRRRSGKGLMLLGTELPLIDGSMQYQLRELLLNLAGVLPEDVERGEYGAVRVPCVEPTEVVRGTLMWAVTDAWRVECDGTRDDLRLWAAGNDDAFSPWVVPGHREYSGFGWLTAEDAWLLLRALWSAEVWTRRVDRARLQATVDLVAEARAALRAQTPGRMFEPDHCVSVVIEVPEGPGREFVSHGDRIETRESGERPLAVSLELREPHLTEDGLEGLIDALGGIDLPNPLPLELRLEAAEPKLVYATSSWWEVREDLWVVQEGPNAVSFCSGTGAEPPRHLDLDWPEVVLLLRTLASVQTWIKESAEEAAAAIVARRRRIVAGRISAQAPSDQMDWSRPRVDAGALAARRSIDRA